MQRTLTCRRFAGGLVVLLWPVVVGLAGRVSRSETPPRNEAHVAAREQRSKRAARATGAPARKPAWTTTTTAGSMLRAGRTRQTAVTHVNGLLYTPPSGSVASPTGTTYSVHHRVGGLVDQGNGPAFACVDIGSLSDPADYIVSFDGVSESLREDVFQTKASVIESDTPQPDGSRLIIVTTSALQGTDLFPGGVIVETDPLTDACFSVGLDDPLSWEGLDTVAQANISFMTDGVVLQAADVTALFSAPWDGVVDIVLEGGAGQGYNGVRLEIRTNKDITPPNDLCDDRIAISDGFQPFSTIGASTDGNEDCPKFGFSNIAADIWYAYTATCTGDLEVSLCDSAYDTKVAVYDGCGRCPPSDPIGCNDDWCGVQSSLGPDLGRVPVSVVQGECYTIRVGGVQGLNGSGNGTLLVDCRDQSDVPAACCLAGNCTMKRQSECVDQQGTWFADEVCGGAFVCPVPPPSNDECVNAIPLETGVPFNGTTVAATGTDQSTCGEGDSNDVWHFWTADCTGIPVFETCGSQFDTTLSVFDACDGAELQCNDDACGPLQSRIDDLTVNQGQTYYLRVSGFGGVTGSYRTLVTGCRHACCLADSVPDCGLVTPAFCDSIGGTAMIGRVCEGDGNGDGVDDACEGCPPEVRITNSDPFTGTVDARRPHEPATPLPREGIGTADEPVLLLLNPSTDGLEGCFSLCETQADQDLGANDIAVASRLPSGLYQLVLDHAVVAGATTTLQYLGDGSFIRIRSHPGNVNADAVADWLDVISLMDCCLEGTCVPTWADRSCDIDRSGVRSPLDILTTIDLLSGAESFAAWNGTPRPPIAGCP